MLLLKIHKIKIKNKVALGNRNDAIHQRNDRILGYVAMSIPAGRMLASAPIQKALNISYNLSKKGFRSAMDWGYKNSGKVESITDFVDSYFPTSTPALSKAGAKGLVIGTIYGWENFND